jgi:Predicted periplasmic or secreted lipoprotein
MRLPRDLDGDDLVKALRSCGYELTRQTGSHMRLTTSVNGEHHVTVPKHSPLRVGTLSGILSDVAAHHGETRDELAARIFK